MTSPPNIKTLLHYDGYLTNYQTEISRRYGVFKEVLARIERDFGGLDAFSKGYEQFGVRVVEGNAIHCREWAPGADSLALIGDFSEFLEKSLWRKSV